MCTSCMNKGDGELQTSLNRNNKGLYQVVVGEGCEVKYYLDPSSTNILYVDAGNYYVLIWKLTVNNEMVDLNRTQWSEGSVVYLLFLSLLFFLTIYVMYITYQMNKSTHLCRTAQICDDSLLDKLINYRNLVLAYLTSNIQAIKFLVVVGALFYFFVTYRNLQRKRRHTQDMEVFTTLMFGNKTDWSVCYKEQKQHLQLGKSMFSSRVHTADPAHSTFHTDPSSQRITEPSKSDSSLQQSNGRVESFSSYKSKSW